jgi:DNA repair exonuclease SbcCD ATPase subunit
MLQLESVGGENFMSYEQLSFDFVSGLYLIIGKNLDSTKSNSNGSGKSALIELAPWVVWGIHERKRVDRNDQGNTKGWLIFNRDGHRYKVTRYKDHKEFENRPFIEVDGEDVTPKRIADANAMILRAFGMSYGLATSTIFVFQNLLQGFCDMSPTIRKQIIEDMIGFSVWDSYKERFNSIGRGISKSVEVIDLAQTNLREQLIALNAQITQKESMTGDLVAKWNQEIADKKVAGNTLLVKKKTDYEAFPLKNIDLVAVTNKVRTLRDQLYGIGQELSGLRSTVNTGKCSYCDEPYKEEKMNSAKTRISSLVEESNKLNPKITQIEADLQLIKEFERARAAIEQQITQCRVDINYLQQQIASVSNPEELEALKLQIVPITDSMEENQTAMTALKEELGGVKYLEGLMLPSSEFRASVISRYLGYVNGILEEIIPDLMDDITVKLELDTKSGLDLVIVKEGVLATYKSLSGGEKRRVSTAIMLSFQRFIIEISGTSSNVLFLDEFLENIDSVGVECVIDCIKNAFPEEIGIYLVSHNTELQSLFENVVTVTKEGGISSIKIASGY